MQAPKLAPEMSAVDEKTKELIAIGAAVAGHCQPCLTHHLAKARELGIGADAIRAAIDVGRMVEKGAMVGMNKFTQQVIGEPAGGAGGCCEKPWESGAKGGG